MLASCRYRFEERIDSAVTTGCWPAWLSGTVRLSAPRQLTEIGTTELELDPVISGDGSTLYFVRGQLGTFDVYAATRADRAEMFAPAVLLSDLSSPEDDSKVMLFDDDRIAVLSTNRTGSQAYDLWQLTRASTFDPFSAATVAPFVNVNTIYNERDPHLLVDGLTLYFATFAPPMMQEIRTATRATLADPFGASVLIDGLLVTPNITVADPIVSPDERLIIYISGGVGTMPQLYYATRSAVNEPFSNAQLIPDIGSVTAVDGDPSLSADGCELFFSSTRATDRELFVATVQ